MGLTFGNNFRQDTFYLELKKQKALLDKLYVHLPKTKTTTLAAGEANISPRPKEQVYDQIETANVTIHCNNFLWKIHAALIFQSIHLYEKYLVFQYHSTPRNTDPIYTINLDKFKDPKKRSADLSTPEPNPLILDCLIHFWYFGQLRIPRTIKDFLHTSCMPNNATEFKDASVLHNDMEFTLRVLEYSQILDDSGLLHHTTESVRALIKDESSLELWYTLALASFSKMSPWLAKSRNALKEMLFEAAKTHLAAWYPHPVFKKAMAIPGFTKAFF